jgi:hypothetical protein
MRYTIFLGVTTCLLWGCNSGETPGQAGGGQIGEHKTGVTFTNPQNPTHGYYVDAFNGAYMAIDVDETVDNPVSIKLTGSDLGTVFATSETPGTFSIKPGTPDLTSGDNTIQIVSAGTVRNINARLGVKNFSPDVTSRSNAAIIRDMRVYGFEERLMNGVTLYKTTLSGFPSPPDLPTTNFQMANYINSIYRQAVLFFDAVVYLSNTLSTRSIGNEDGTLDIYENEANLGPEVVELLRTINITPTDNIGFYVRDFSQNWSYTGSIMKGTRFINMAFDVEGHISPDDRLIIGPATAQSPNQCTDQVQVSSVNRTIITLREDIQCDEHPSPGAIMERNHYIKLQNSNSPLGVAYSSRNFFIIEARSLDEVSHTVAHELGHLPNVGDFEDNTIPDNLMNTGGSGSHLRNDQWEALNR